MQGFEGGVRVRGPVKLLASIIVVLAGVVAAPQTAFAGSSGLYASPDGSGVECTEQNPCALRTAVDNAPFEENVLLFDGSYELGSETLAIDNQNDVMPADPTVSFGPPILRSSAPGFAVQVNGDDSSLRDAVIVSQSSQAALLLTGAGTPMAERVAAVNRGVLDQNTQEETGNGCTVQSGILRDSLCWGNGTGATGFSDGIEMSTFGGTVSAKLRNVTAYSDQGSGIYLGAFGSGGSTTLDARNVIFQSGAGQDDIQVFGDAGSSVDADIDSSNYDSLGDLASDSEVSSPGSGSNQTAPPVFSDPANGDFSQAPGSPTIDAGDSTASDLGTADLGLSARMLGPAIDIGAYETANPDTAAPVVRITKNPSKRTRKRTATFRFTASDDTTSRSDLQVGCTLDKRAEPPCKSPRRYRNLKPGRHVFVVFATDEAGNVSRGGRYVWTVKKRKRRG